MAKSTANAKGMPVRTAELDFDGLYAGYHATVRTNPLYGSKMDLFSGDRERFERGLKAIVVAWDFVDPDGVLCPTGDPTNVPDDLLGELVSKWAEAVNEATKVAKN